MAPLNTSNKSWNEWSQHILAELIRLNTYCEKMEARLGEIENDFNVHVVACPLKTDVNSLASNVTVLTNTLHETCMNMKSFGVIMEKLTEQVRLTEVRSAVSRKWLNRLAYPLIALYVLITTYMAILHAADILKLF